MIKNAVGIDIIGVDCWIPTAALRVIGVETVIITYTLTDHMEERTK